MNGRIKESVRRLVHNRASKVMMLAWFPLITSLLYGYLEASINSNFPLYGLRIRLTDSDIGLLLPMIGIVNSNSECHCCYPI